MSLLDNLAARLGFVRVPDAVGRRSWLPVQYHAPLSEIIVFERQEEAREAGFRGWQHPKAPHIKAYWPGANLGVFASRPFQRVTIPHRMLRHQTPEGSLVAILKSRQQVFYPDAIWVVL